LDHLLSRVYSSYLSQDMNSTFKWTWFVCEAYVWLSEIIGVFDIQEGELAQLGERLLCTQEVSGSIPLFSTILKKVGVNKT
jgi:hypothetical protein